MKTVRTFLLFLVFGQDLFAISASGETIQYLLLGESTFTDECPICDRVSIAQPMRGAFEMTLVPTGLGAAQYKLSNVAFQVGSGSNAITLTGSGTYWRFLGHPLSQQMEFDLQVTDSTTNRNLHFTNETQEIIRQVPMLDVNAFESPGTLSRSYSLRVVAAPIRELWFSPHQDSGNPGTSSASGDIISQAGRLVKSRQQLFGVAGVNVPAEIDAFDAAPGGEIVFSSSKPVFSETLGPIGEGDLLSARGTLFRRNSDLLRAFDPVGGPADAGLDAFQVLDSGEIYFSTRSNIFSGKLGSIVSHGDILSDSGEVLINNHDLLQAFNPPPFDPKDSDSTYGLTAFYIWPGSEVWFSTSKDFVSPSLGPISRGDILSDRGYIVFSAALLQANAGNSSTNGLSGFFIVTDTSIAPELPAFDFVKAHSFGIDLKWTGMGRVFRVEQASAVTGSFNPVSALLPDAAFTVPINEDFDSGFFRLRQW